MNTTTIGQRLLLVILLTMAGCIAAEKAGKTPPPTIAEQMNVNTAKQCDRLVVVGAIAVAIGIAAFLAGQTKATAIIGFGVSLSTIGLFLTIVLSTITAYRGWFVGAFIVLSIIGLFTFVRAIGDVNRDGKIDLQDVKSLFLKIPHKSKTQNADNEKTT
jgi:hypothetical protein